MTIVLILFAIAAVVSAAVLLLNHRSARDGRRAVPQWLVIVNLAVATVTAVLALLVVTGGG